MKKIIRLTERDLTRIVKRMIKEEVKYKTLIRRFYDLDRVENLVNFIMKRYGPPGEYFNSFKFDVIREVRVIMLRTLKQRGIILVNPDSDEELTDKLIDEIDYYIDENYSDLIEDYYDNYNR